MFSGICYRICRVVKIVGVTVLVLLPVAMLNMVAMVMVCPLLYPFAAGEYILTGENYYTQRIAHFIEQAGAN